MSPFVCLSPFVCPVPLSVSSRQFFFHDSPELRRGLKFEPRQQNTAIALAHYSDVSNRLNSRVSHIDPIGKTTPAAQKFKHSRAVTFVPARLK